MKNNKIKKILTIYDRFHQVYERLRMANQKLIKDARQSEEQQKIDDLKNNIQKL